MQPASYNERNKGRVILDLCGGTGSWSEPYRTAGYDVRLVTLPEHDIHSYTPPTAAYGVLAAPPCTHLCNAGAPSWKSKGLIALKQALQLVYLCLIIIQRVQPHFWCLENPKGRLARFLGKPVMTFHPFEYGDPWTKRTLLWGTFKPPYKTFQAAVPHYRHGSLRHTSNRSMIRSITPPRFARAFFEANQ